MSIAIKRWQEKSCHPNIQYVTLVLRLIFSKNQDQTSYAEHQKVCYCDIDHRGPHHILRQEDRRRPICTADDSNTGGVHIFHNLYSCDHPDRAKDHKQNCGYHANDLQCSSFHMYYQLSIYVKPFNVPGDPYTPTPLQIYPNLHPWVFPNRLWNNGRDDWDHHTVQSCIHFDR